MVDRSEIIVTMTSIPERIELDITPTIDSIISDKILTPDKLILNLAKSQFPEMVVNLPEKLIEYNEHHENVEICWVDHDIKTYKKLIPTLMRYKDKPDTMIMTIDDDCLYEPGLLRGMVDLKSVSGPNSYVTTANLANFFNVPVPMGRCSMYTPNLFDTRIVSWLTDEIIDLNEDDFFYAFIMFITGVLKSCRFYKTNIKPTQLSIIKPANYNTYKTFDYYSNLVRTIINQKSNMLSGVLT